MILSDKDTMTVNRLFDKLKSYIPINDEHEKYYEGKNLYKNFQISIPLKFNNTPASIRWGGQAIDQYNSRLNLEGIMGPKRYEKALKEIFESNKLAYRSRMGILDCLIFGTSYAVIGQGDPTFNEPAVKITFHSPNNIIGKRNSITGRLEEVLQVHYGDLGEIEHGAIYYPNHTIWFKNEGGFQEYYRQEHNLGRVPVIQLVSSPRTNNPNGQAFIDSPMRNLIDEAERTYVAMALMRELHAFPQKFISGAHKNDFVTKDGKAKSNILQAYTQLIHILSQNEKGESPTISQFTSSSPAGLIEQVNLLKEEFAAMVALPIGYFGKQTQNPPSADSIRAMEASAIKKAEDMIDSFTDAFTEIMQVSLLMSGKTLGNDSNSIRPLWRDPATPTKAANGDFVVKLVSQGILDAQADSTLDQLNFSEATKIQIKKEREEKTNNSEIVPSDEEIIEV